MQRLSRGERFVQALFRTSYGVDLVKIEEKPDVPNADFEHLLAGSRDFVAELKGFVWQPPSTDRGWLVPEHGFAERADNGPQRVAAKIHEAFRQLSERVEPRILLLLNSDNALDVMDLEEAYQGFLPYVSSDGFFYVNRLSKPISEGRIRDEKALIDLYAWIDWLAERKPTIQFRFPTLAGERLIDAYFTK